jgi:hypothetical protein
MHWKLDVVGVRKKARHLMESGEISAKKIGRTVKKKKKKKREREAV